MITVSRLSKSFGGRWVITDLNLHVDKGETIGLVGPSGIGKSTTLNIIAGLLEPDVGEVRIDGRLVTRFGFPGGDILVHPADRGLGYVMQDNALFPNMTALANVTFGLEALGMTSEAIQTRAREMVQLLRIEDVAHLYPHQLSGGQQKRVALARSLAPQPKVLLMDEPLSSLDQKLKEHLKSELKGIFDRLDLTVIYVTHDLEEARFLVDRIADFGCHCATNVDSCQCESLTAQTGFRAWKEKGRSSSWKKAER